MELAARARSPRAEVPSPDETLPSGAPAKENGRDWLAGQIAEPHARFRCLGSHATVCGSRSGVVPLESVMRRAYRCTPAPASAPPKVIDHGPVEVLQRSTRSRIRPPRPAGTPDGAAIVSAVSYAPALDVDALADAARGAQG